MKVFFCERVFKRERIVMAVEPTALKHFKLTSFTDPLTSYLLAVGVRRRKEGGLGLVGEVDWQQGFNFNGMFSRASPFPS